MPATTLVFMVMMSPAGISRGDIVVWSENFNYVSGQTLLNNGWVMTIDAGSSVYPPYWESKLDSGIFVSASQSMTQVAGQGYSWLGMAASHSFAAVSQGKASLWMRASHNSGGVNPARFYISGTGGNIALVNFAAQYGIYLNDRVWLGAYNAGQWYYLELSWNDTNHSLTLFVQGVGTVTDSYLQSVASGANVFEAYHHCVASTSGPAQAWYDDIVVSDVTNQPCSTFKAGDLNQDCYVNFADFALFVQDWLKCDDPGNGDCF